MIPTIKSRPLAALVPAPLLILCLLDSACGGGPAPSGSAPTLTVIAPAYAIEGMAGYQASVPARPGATYAWTLDNGSILSGGSADTVTFLAGTGDATRLVCTETDATGTSTWGQKAVPLKAGPVIASAGPLELGHGTDTLTVPAVPGMTYAWEVLGGEILEGQGTPTVTIYDAPLDSGSAQGAAMPKPMPRAGAARRPVQVTVAVRDRAGRGAASSTTFQTVEQDSQAPSGLVYEKPQAAFTLGQPIGRMLQHSGGGSVTSYSVSPALPAGIVLDPDSGFISGTPTVAADPATYTVTASNALGSASAVLTLSVQDAAPLTLAYGYSSATFTTGKPITADAPSELGAAGAAYTVTPPLPAGLSLDPATGIISGTPRAVTAQAKYTVTAANAAGSAQANLTFTVNDAPPAGLSYAYANGTFTAGNAITSDSPTNAGGAVVSYSVAPALPAGLSLDPRSGLISGTLAATVLPGTYAVTVTAANTGGSTTENLAFTVNAAAPTALSYANTPGTLFVGTAISPETPFFTGGAPLSYSVSPDLPQGLSLNSSTGILSGTPQGVVGQNTYTVTAANAAGSATATLAFQVENPLIFTAQPADVTTFTGRRATFSVSGTGGTGTLTYQWMKDGIPIQGATSATYVTPVLTTAGTSQYSATVTDTGGLQTASASAALTVAQAQPRFAFAANPGDGTLSCYTVVPATGQLRDNGYVKVGTRPVAVLVDPTERYVFVANRNDDTVSCFTLDASTGALTPAGTTQTGSPSGSGGGSGSTAASQPVALATDPAGAFLYVANFGAGTVSAFSIGTGGALASLGAPVAAGTSPVALAVESTGRFVYVLNQGTGAGTSGPAQTGSGQDGTVQAYAIQTDGSLAPAGNPVVTGVFPQAMALSPDGRFACVPAGGSLYLYPIDPAAGTLGTPVTPLPAIGLSVMGIAFDPGGSHLFIANSGSGGPRVGSGTTLEAYGFDSITGALSSALTTTPSTGTLSSMAVDPSGAFVYMAGGGGVTPFAWNPGAASAPTSLTTGTPTLTLGTKTFRTRTFSSALALSVGAAPVTYKPGYVYAAEQAPSASSSFYVTQFTLDTGTLAGLSGGGNAYLPTGSDPFPNWISTDPAGRFAYVTDGTASTVYSFTIDPSTGYLAHNLPDSATDTNPGPSVVDPSGRFLYCASAQQSPCIDCFVIGANGLPGSKTTVSLSGSVYPLTMDPTGRFVYAATTDSLYAFSADPQTGQLTSIPGSPVSLGAGAGVSPAQVAVDPTGRFVYVVSTPQDTLGTTGSDFISYFTLDASSGLPTAVRTSPLVLPASNLNGTGLALDPAGDFAYLTLNSADLPTGALMVLSLDAGTGTPTVINASTGASSSSQSVLATDLLATSNPPAGSPVVDPSGAFLLVPEKGTCSVYTITPGTGALTLHQDLADIVPPLGTPPQGSFPRSLAVTTKMQ